MSRYIGRRLLLAIPTLFLTTMLLFYWVHWLPGGPAAVACGIGCTPKQQDEMASAMGLDRPLPEQYGEWLGNILRGDFGTSLNSGTSISEQLQAKGPVTGELGLLALVIAIAIAVPIGIVSAVKRDSPLDYVVRTLAAAITAIPSFWLAIVLIALGSRYGVWTPPINYQSLVEDPGANLAFMIPPAILLGISLSGGLVRIVRAQMLEQLRQDYIRTARSKGLRGSGVVMRHAVRNALIPVVTVIGLQVPILVGGSVIIETIFSVPGLGRYLIDSVSRSDLPVIQAVTVLLAVVVIVTNLLTDVAYGVIDPRIKHV